MDEAGWTNEMFNCISFNVFSISVHRQHLVNHQETDNLCNSVSSSCSSTVSRARLIEWIASGSPTQWRSEREVIFSVLPWILSLGELFELPPFLCNWCFRLVFGECLGVLALLELEDPWTRFLARMRWAADIEYTRLRISCPSSSSFRCACSGMWKSVPVAPVFKWRSSNSCDFRRRPCRAYAAPETN